MPVKDGQMIKIDAVAGINNLSPENSQAISVLREAVNVELSKEGKASRRPGRTRLIAGTKVHSIWSDPKLDFALYADGDSIFAFSADIQPQLVTTGISNNLPISYALVNDQVYWSNSMQSGVITLGLEGIPWGCVEPSGQPLLAGSSAGGLYAGEYQVAITYRDVFGRESGSTLASAVQVSDSGGIALTSIPQPAMGDMVSVVRIYATAANDTSLRHVADIPVGMTSFNIGKTNRGKLLDTQHLVKMPAGHIVRYGHGRMWAAKGKELIWSEPLRYGLYNETDNRITFPERITMVQTLGDGADGAGVFVSSGNRTYWLSGPNPSAMRQNIAYPHGVVEGTDLVTPSDIWGIESVVPVVAWMATNHKFCIGLPSGQVMPIKSNEAVIDIGERGASIIKETNGIRQFISAISAAQPSALKVSDRISAVTVHHDGTTS